MTNDLGQFRIYGLAPGEYYVSATLRNMNMMVMDLMGGGAGGPSGSNQTSGYAATYYPSTPSPGDAQRITLAVGQELSSVDIQLQPVKLARITGNAIGGNVVVIGRGSGDGAAVCVDARPGGEGTAGETGIGAGMTGRGTTRSTGRVAMAGLRVAATAAAKDS